jgi:hypothetical protein
VELVGHCYYYGITRLHPGDHFVVEVGMGSVGVAAWVREGLETLAGKRPYQRLGGGEGLQ